METFNIFLMWQYYQIFGAWIAQTVEHETVILRVTVSSPCSGGISIVIASLTLFLQRRSLSGRIDSIIDSLQIFKNRILVIPQITPLPSYVNLLQLTNWHFLKCRMMCPICLTAQLQTFWLKSQVVFKKFQFNSDYTNNHWHGNSVKIIRHWRC